MNFVKKAEELIDELDGGNVSEVAASKALEWCRTSWDETLPVEDRLGDIDLTIRVLQNARKTLAALHDTKERQS